MLDGLALLDEGILAGLGGGRAHEAALDGGRAHEARRGAQDLSLREHFRRFGGSTMVWEWRGSIVSDAGISMERDSGS